MDRQIAATAGRQNDDTVAVEQSSRILELEREVARLREENERLLTLSPQNSNGGHTERSQLEIISNNTTNSISVDQQQQQEQAYQPQGPLPPVTKLTPAHIERYSRQLLLPRGFGVTGQHKLLSSSVLVVGAGGIGSTVLLYLAAAGIGRISVLDFDVVERSNLHRQIIHSEHRVGWNKAVSACRAMRELNPSIVCRALPIMLTHENALALMTDHDCIVDASDNPRTRYLINDACVLAGKPLVSGSAIGTEGQLSVLNWKPGEGPCYRCLYPKPSITAGAKSCSDNGVLGPVPGLMGVLQSLEVLKVLTETGNPMNNRLLMYDALECTFLNLKKPQKQPTCPVCSTDHATILSMEDSAKDLQATRGPASCEVDRPSALDDKYHVTCAEYAELRNRKAEQQEQPPILLLDVRVKEQYDLCSLGEAINIPLETLSQNFDRVEKLSNGWTKSIFCLCRRGIASVEATKLLNDHIIVNKEQPKKDAVVTVKNIKGGLDAWRMQVDKSFPQY